MPTPNRNPLQRAQQWYDNLDVTGIENMIDAVAEDHVSAQLMIQHFEHEFEQNEIAKRHGTCIAAAYLLAFDSDEDMKFIRRMAPKLYPLARDMIDG